MDLKLYPHQEQALKLTKGKNKVAYYLDMGLGKTFCATEKMMELGAKTLVICPKSMIKTWINHLQTYYPKLTVVDYTSKAKHLNADVIVINYDLIWRRKELHSLKDFTLILDESSYIKSDTAKRTKCILKLKPKNIILLSGTPTGGKYEELYTQIKLLGWDISKTTYWDTYIKWINLDVGTGFPIKKVTGYKNVERLKRKLGEHGAVFMKTEEVFNLPDQIDITIDCEVSKEYKIFKKDHIVTINGTDLIGDTPLKRMLYYRQLCSYYNKDKLEKLKDLIESTEDRLIIFYNFTEEMEQIKKLTKKPISIINGATKDLTAYENESNSITLIQYRAGSMGLNLQKANKIIYFSLPLSSEFFEQSKKRTHRIGQSKTCFYYYLICKNSIETDIYKTLKERKDYTDELFKKGDY